MVGFAKKGDDGEIAALFGECFGEDPIFNTYFFKKFFKVEQTVVYRQNDHIAAMAIKMPYRHSSLGDVSYIYGACTAKEYRRKGIMSKIIEFCAQDDIEKGVKASILIPENDSLFGFYEKHGYKKAFYCEDKIWEFHESINNNFSELDLISGEPKEVTKIYNSAMSGRGHIIRSESYTQAQIRLYDDLGGCCIMLTYKNEPIGYGFIADRGNNDNPALVQEMIAPKDYLDIFKNMILCKIKRKKGRFITPNYGEGKPFGCIRLHSGDTDLGADMMWYMNVMFN